MGDAGRPDLTMLTVGAVGPEDQESPFLWGAALSRPVTLWQGCRADRPDSPGGRLLTGESVGAC